MKPEEFFKKTWGTGFIKANLQEQDGLLTLSMKDIYQTMEEYHQHRLAISEEEISQFYWKYAEESDVEDTEYMEIFRRGFKACLSKLKQEQ